jgi:hypothetical protein
VEDPNGYKVELIQLKNQELSPKEEAMAGVNS